MAYLAFQDLGGATAALGGITPLPDAVPATGDRLTALEWTVVAIARGDKPGTHRRPGPLAKLTALLMPRRPDPRLADPRLEALRLAAGVLWRDE